MAVAHCLQGVLLVGAATDFWIVGIKLLLITVDVKVGGINFEPSIASFLFVSLFVAIVYAIG